MNLQDVFYGVAIIFMVLSILILVGIGVVLFYIQRKISHIHDSIQDKLEALNRVAKHPGDVAMDVGTSLAASAFKKVRKFIDEKE